MSAFQRHTGRVAAHRREGKRGAELGLGTAAVQNVKTPALTGYQVHAITSTADTALATQASGGTQIGNTVSSVVIPAAGV